MWLELLIFWTATSLAVVGWFAQREHFNCLASFRVGVTAFTPSSLLGDRIGRGIGGAPITLPFPTAILESMGFVIFALVQLLSGHHRRGTL